VAKELRRSKLGLAEELASDGVEILIGLDSWPQGGLLAAPVWQL